MPTSAELLKEGQRRLASGDRHGAAAWLRLIEPTAPERSDALIALGRALMADGKFGEAASWLREVAGLAPAARFMLGRCLLALGRADEAEALFTAALEEAAGHDVASLVMRSHCEVKQGRLTEAVKTLDVALRLDPRFIAARFYLAEALVRTGDLKRADLQLHYVIKAKPDYGPGLALRGEVSRRLGSFRQAVVDLHEAHRLMPTDAAVLARLGDAFTGLKDQPQALLAYDEAIKRDPACWPAYVGAARLLETPDGVYEARRFYRALAASPAYAAEAEAGQARINTILTANQLPEHAPWRSPVARATAFSPPEGSALDALGPRPGSTATLRPPGAPLRPDTSRLGTAKLDPNLVAALGSSAGAPRGTGPLPPVPSAGTPPVNPQAAPGVGTPLPIPVAGATPAPGTSDSLAVPGAELPAALSAGALVAPALPGASVAMVTEGGPRTVMGPQTAGTPGFALNRPPQANAKGAAERPPTGPLPPAPRPGTGALDATAVRGPIGTGGRSSQLGFRGTGPLSAPTPPERPPTQAGDRGGASG